jgi:hypothetical protein
MVIQDNDKPLAVLLRYDQFNGHAGAASGKGIGLLTLRGFSDHEKRVLTGIQGSAFMNIKRGGNLSLCIGAILQIGRELRTAPLADPGEVRSGFLQCGACVWPWPEFTADPRACGFQTAPLPRTDFGGGGAYTRLYNQEMRIVLRATGSQWERSVSSCLEARSRPVVFM